MKCFNCDEEGHLAWQCGRNLSPVPPAGLTSATRRPAVPPTEDYLFARAELGIPRDTDANTILAIRCPWCEAGPWQPCMNRALDQPKKAPHEARIAAAGLDVPLRPAYADLARRQADESRASRSLLPLSPAGDKPVDIAETISRAISRTP